MLSRLSPPAGPCRKDFNGNDVRHSRVHIIAPDASKASLRASMLHLAQQTDSELNLVGQHPNTIPWVGYSRYLTNTIGKYTWRIHLHRVLQVK